VKTAAFGEGRALIGGLRNEVGECGKNGGLGGVGEPFGRGFVGAGTATYFRRGRDYTGVVSSQPSESARLGAS